MAARILGSHLMRQAQSNGPTLPLRLSSASMSSSNTPVTQTSSSKAPATTDGNQVGKSRTESWAKKIATLFGADVEPANLNDPPIPVTKANFPDITEKSTGEAKLLLLAFENGILDPYCNLPAIRDGKNGTKDNPIIIESFFEKRMVACACEPTQTFFRYTTVYKGEPKRCNCGFWLKCVDAPRFWEKIPKEDLLDIAFFRDLEADGKLDKFLETGELDEKDKVGLY